MSGTTAKRPPEGMAGLAKGLAILEAFGPTCRELNVADAARAAGISPAAARRCLLTLTELGYLHQDGRAFQPTPRMLRLSDGYLTGSTLASLAQTYAEVGRDQIGEAVSVAIYEDGSALFIARAAVERIVSMGVRLGAKLPAYASATGRVLLSGLLENEREAYLKSIHPKATTPNTLTKISDIRNRIDAAATDGYSMTNEELEVGMRTLAVPVKDAHGRIRAALSSSAFTARATIEDMLTEHLPVLTKQATELGRRL
ncbi:IclR family transcriptional regulator C-terminal domain-containing protein [uncultured Citricoccus sp.]|uniref:IclR family transcriptional regulator domain-containing protein n=1 Tax=uncultured Citricoccus sp. TaxID=614031 RepID=UPI0026223E93|nr:IclR family transcriptional regulator C-terminal domain-containing protein [uncultured Citricoccus sp.]